MKLLQCVSLVLLCLHFVKSRGVKPNILKTSGNQENKYVLNTGEYETNNREKEIEITSNKGDVVHEVYNIPVKNSLKRNNELYNLKNHFGIKHLNNKNRLGDKTVMNARKQNSKAKTDKKRKYNGKIILNNLNPSRRYTHIDPGLNSILDSLLLDNDGHVRHIYDRRDVLLEDYNYDRNRPFLAYVPSNVARARQLSGKGKTNSGKGKTKSGKGKTKSGKGKTKSGKGKMKSGKGKMKSGKGKMKSGKGKAELGTTKKQQVKQQKPQNKKTNNKYQRQTTKKTVKMSDYLQDAKGSLLGHITVNGKTYRLDDLSKMNMMIEI